MLTREEFLVLLARLRGEGEALSTDELRSLLAYATEHQGDVEAITDAEIGDIEAGCQALGDDDDVTTDGLLAAVEVVEGIREVAAARFAAAEAAAEAEAQAEAERQALRDRLRGEPVAETTEPGDGGEPGGEPAEGGEPAGEPAETDGGEPAAEPAAEPAETEPAGEPVAVGASSTAPRRPVPTVVRRASGQVQPTGPRRRQRNRIVRDGGGEFDDIAALGEAMFDRRASFLNASPGFSEMIKIGRIEADYAPEHVLDPHRSAEQIAAVVSALQGSNRMGVTAEDFDAVTSSGGFCAPEEPYYGYMELATASRPFRAGLQQRNAGRGKILFRTPPDFPDFAGAVSQWTATNDANPGADGPSTKPCLVVECPDTDTAEIYAVTECLTIGNFMARTDPETVTNAVNLTLAAFARKAETLLIDAMKAASTQVTAGDALGAYRDLVYQIGVAAAGYRSRHRMDVAATLEIRLPSWVYDLVLLDITRSLPGDGNLVAGRDLFDRALARHNVRIASLYIDSPTSGPQQVFGPQNATGLVDFPSAVQWQICAPGSFLLLDNGRLDLGVTRDMELIRTNDYSTFAETFEGLAFVGLESNWITSTVCPNGASSGTVDPSTFCSGDYVPA